MPRTTQPVVPAGTMASVEQPVIEIDHEVTLRPFAERDAPAVERAFNDPDIVRWHSFRVDSLDQALAWIERNHEQWRLEKSAIWAVVDANDQVLGRCAVHTELEDGSGEIAYWTLRDARGRGVARRAAAAVTRWAHHELGLHRIVLQHAADNLASCAVAERLGYVAEGMARDNGLHADGWHDMHQHAHIATDPVPD